ncbi:MAG: carboxypeptidase-like regulatory domain-containing protein [Patiriisocius sp.]|uniref:carboxypeptidase-like regulatory domain-containing protein n=1 Tax=Patiriisocius sp. TaxID=2822396 RepID=UPI003EF6366F
MKKFIFTFFTLFVATSSTLAQEAVVKGRVVDTNSSDVIPDVSISIESSIYSTETDAEGLFLISSTELPQGEQVLRVTKQGYVAKRIPITIQSGNTLNLDPLQLELDLTEIEAQIGIISLSDNELDQDEGTSFNTSGLLQANNDAFLNAAAFDFSATFFRPRGLDNADGKLLINGIEMNKQLTGRPQWSNWGGLNDVQRNREFSMGLSANDASFGGVAGTTNIIMRASQYREGGRVSFASSDRSYRGRIMGTYNSGLLQSGWAYSFSLARRFGDEGYQDGTLYDANSFFVSVEKKINDAHSLNFTGFYTPNRRGRSTAITQEMRDLRGIRYNPNWGFQDGDQRNSRIREIEEPVLMLNHYWNMGENTTLNTNVAYQFGKSGQTRIDNGGTRLVIIDGQESYIGGARNPFGNYYQRLPSYFLREDSPSPYDYQLAYQAQQEFINDGQLDWNSLYFANTTATNVANGGNSIYAIQEDRTDDTQITLNSILNTEISENIILNAAVNYRSLKSENFAELSDLLGGAGYLDVDFFAGDDEQAQEVVVGDIAQSDLRNRNRIAQEGDRYKYNYEMKADVISGFAQGQFKYQKVDFYAAVTGSNTTYQRNGLFENGNYPGAASFGESEQLSFTNFGLKAGATYKVSGRHLVDLNLGSYSKAPNLRNSFSNARINNETVFGLESEKVNSVDLSYIFRSPIVKARLTGFYTQMSDKTDIGFYFTENISGIGIEQDAFVQEVMTGIDQRHVGAELGIEAQVTPTIKLKGAASMGNYTFSNNPNLYLTSDDIDGRVTFGDGTAKLKDYHVAGGPERAYQIGFEYRDPDFWWVGVTGNFFSNAYIDVNNLARTSNFTSDFDGNTFNDYDETEARELLQQEQFDSYSLVNVVGGKSWKIGDYYTGFFATINNVFDQEYKTGGFEQGRKTNYRDVQEDTNSPGGRIFGNRYFFGNGTTYYLNLYVRF